MKSKRLSLTSAGIAIFLGLFLGFAGGVSAQSDPTTITIHLSECPVGYDGDNPFTDCHDNPLPGVTFRWGVDAPMVPVAVVTDANGVAFIDSEPLFIDEDPPFDLASFSVYCSTNDGADEVPVIYSSGGIGIVLSNQAATGNVICDWYNVPLGTSDDGSSAGTTTTLPATGVGASSNASATEIELLSVALIVGAVGLSLRRRPAR